MRSTVTDFNTQDVAAHLGAAFSAAAPHLLAAGREMLLAGEAFVEALTGGLTDEPPARPERIVVED